MLLLLLVNFILSNNYFCRYDFLFSWLRDAKYTLVLINRVRTNYVKDTLRDWNIIPIKFVNY